MAQIDIHAAEELRLYVDNDGALYRQQTTPIIKNLATKMAKGIYEHSKAVKLFMYLAESGAKKYGREFAAASEWNVIFTVPTRRAVAEEWAKEFEQAWKNGEYRNLLPKKYQ